MSALYNDYVLETSLSQHWISFDQHQALLSALENLPGTSALELMREQQVLGEEHLTALEHAIHEATQATPESHAATEEETAHDVEVLEGIPGGFTHMNQFLDYAVKLGASDAHVGTGAAPLVRRFGNLVPMWDGAPLFHPEHVAALAKGFLTSEQWHQLEKNLSLEFSYDVDDLARFRSSIVRQRKGLSCVFRVINTNVRTMAELNLPETLHTLTKFHNGLVLITGAVGSGKSTTLAAMVDQINQDRSDHIITLEDPIEYIFKPKGCHITQREVHSHTKSFAAALRASLREDPDIIMVGEMRDLETISLAITASETGHLVLGTLHTSSASRTLDRVLDVFPIEQQAQIRIMVGESLRGIVSQQLVPKADGTGRVLAMEILVNTPAVQNLIREAKTFMLPGVIQTGRKLGMRLMDDSLLQLLEDGIIAKEEAYDRADNKKLFEKFMK
jgi:twitching motility protein PilT